MKHLCRLWKGELALNDAFWNWAVFGGLTVNIATSAAFLMLMAAGLSLWALIVGYALPVPYNIFVAVGVWRSAGRYTGDRRWADAARVVTVIGMALLSLI